MGRQKDFAEEVNAFQELMRSYGHRAEMSPKCHPEVAGCGVEYCWGKSKMHFRRHTDHVAKHLVANAKLSMCTTNVLFKARVRKFARKARSYRRAYSAGIAGHAVVEKHCKQQKVHRSALDQDYAYLKNA